jgi:hypothetical protein
MVIAKEITSFLDGDLRDYDISSKKKFKKKIT